MHYSYDLHIHSCLSPCGSDDMTPAIIAGIAKVNELDIAALTDHNTCRNCPAFLRAAHEYELAALCGMELTTAEDIHVLCLFETIEAALSFDQYVYARLIPVKNRPSIFGNQTIYDENDEKIGTEDLLLINATSISFNDVHDLVASYEGVALPAHIDKESNGALAILGAIPEEAHFTAYEIANPTFQPDGIQLPHIVDSDAHYLEDIGKKGGILDLDCPPLALPHTILQYLREK